MVMLRSRRLNLKGLSPSQYRVLTLLAENGSRALSAIVRLSGMDDASLIVGDGATGMSGFRHSLTSLGFVVERNGTLFITDSGREFLSGLGM